MEEILVVVIIAVATALSKSAKKVKSNKAVQYRKAYEAMQKAINTQTLDAQLRMEETLDAAPTPPAPEPAADQKPAPAVEMHQHEGKPDIPCPAIEREKPRVKPETPQTPAAPVIPGLNLTFDRNSVVQGVVMSEILNRPRVGARR